MVTKNNILSKLLSSTCLSNNCFNCLNSSLPLIDLLTGSSSICFCKLNAETSFHKLASLRLQGDNGR